MPSESFNVLFLCTGNSARSIMAESILNALGKGKFRAFSTGSHPTRTVNPLALEIIETNGLPTKGLRSKDWNEFAVSNAPFMHFVFTVCDQAAAEACPVWSGQPMTAHWGVHDPAAVEGDDNTRRKAFLKAYTELYRRISLFTALPFENLDKLALKAKLEEIGRPEWMPKPPQSCRARGAARHTPDNEPRARACRYSRSRQAITESETPDQ